MTLSVVSIQASVVACHILFRSSNWNHRLPRARRHDPLHPSDLAHGRFSSSGDYSMFETYGTSSDFGCHGQKRHLILDPGPQHLVVDPDEGIDEEYSVR